MSTRTCRRALLTSLVIAGAACASGDSEERGDGDGAKVDYVARADAICSYGWARMRVDPDVHNSSRKWRLVKARTSPDRRSVDERVHKRRPLGCRGRRREGTAS